MKPPFGVVDAAGHILVYASGWPHWDHEDPQFVVRYTYSHDVREGRSGMMEGWS
jgi:hypothetical protein